MSRFFTADTHWGYWVSGPVMTTSTSIGVKMPRYEYVCITPNCNHVVEVLSSVADKPKQMTCDKCGAVMAQFWSSAPGIAFKGSGWTPKGR